MHFYSNEFTAPVSHRYALDTACFSVEVNPIDRATYRSSVEVVELAPLSIALVDSRASIVLRKNEEISSAQSQRFSFLYAVDGDMMISHQHGTTTLNKGQFTLIDNSHPRTMFVYNQVTLLVVCVSRTILQRYIAIPENAVAQVLHEPQHSHGTPMFTPLLALWEHLKGNKLNTFAANIATDLLGSIGSTYAKHHYRNRRSLHASHLVTRVKQFIESNLDDASLHVEAIAAHFRISSRYLRTLFQGGERLSQYIQRRRLEESARLLLSPLHQAMSITDIAYRCGFGSSTHFARCFKAMYGERARDFRRRHAAMMSDASHASVPDHTPSAGNT